jgi:hypothetical protein
MKQTEVRGHVAAIKRAVEAQLPEDEPDCVRTWVYETAVKVMAERLRAVCCEGRCVGHIAGESLAGIVARRIKTHGGVRAASRALGVDAAYLVRLRDGGKERPSWDTLAKLLSRGADALVATCRAEEHAPTLAREAAALLEPVDKRDEPACQHGVVEWCQCCDDEAREAGREAKESQP